MIKIRNLEEKKRIIVYKKCLYNRHPENMLCNSRIYDVWLRMWRDDFVVNGKCLKMWHQKFVESVAKHRHKQQAPDYYAEYNDLINSVTDWVNEHYNIKWSMSRNKEHCLKILNQYRQECEIGLKELLLEKNLDYKVVNNNPNSMLRLAKYKLLNGEELMHIADFEEMKEFIINKL